MDRDNVEHIVDAARVLGRYADALGVRSFPRGRDWSVTSNRQQSSQVQPGREWGACADAGPGDDGWNPVDVHTRKCILPKLLSSPRRTSRASGILTPSFARGALSQSHGCRRNSER